MSRAEGTGAKGDGVTGMYRGGKVAELRRKVCTPVGATIMRGNYHILSMKQSVTARNLTQNKQRGKIKSMRMY